MIDRDEFLRLLLTHERDLRAFLGALVADRHAREDLFQETALVLWQQCERYDPARPFGAWARGVAAAILCLAAGARAEEKEKPKAKSFGGAVAKIEGASLTVVARGDKEERTEVFAVDANAKVMVETDEDVEVQGGEGGGKKVPKLAEAKLGDLKVGQRVTVLYEESGKAVKVLGHRAPAKKPSKEGNG